MPDILTPSSDIAFTPSVKAIQQRKGSRKSYALVEERGGWSTHVTPELAAFIGQQTSFFLGTANADGQPYIQHRGGPRGFLHVLDGKTLAFADYSGNRQFITQGNLAENQKAFIFLIDYMNRSRVKIWGTAQIIEGDENLMARLMPKDYRARPEQALVFHVEAFDMNCPQHIPQRFDAEDVSKFLASRDQKIAALEAELKSWRESYPSPSDTSPASAHS